MLEEREMSKQATNEGSPELQITKKKSMFKGADAHRGEPKLDPASDDMMRFTATGRPFVPEDRYQSTWNGLGNADAFQGTAGKTLPFKYTDESFISVPCLKPRAQESATSIGEPNEKKPKWWRRKSSTSSNSVNDPNNFTMKKIQRGDYLKHYAKDEQGDYIGTEEPAEDCILRGKDLERYRSSKDAMFQNEISEDKADRPALIGMEKQEGDAIIR